MLFLKIFVKDDAILPAMKSHIIIAIDGPAASGKGTLARALAERLGLAYFDTGTLYRGVAKAVLDAGLDPDNEKNALEAAQKITFADLNGPGLRTVEVSRNASVVGKFPSVRTALLDFQRNFAHTPQEGKNGVVLDGRDIGTVICPDADLKLFVTASTDVRAKRRFDELRQKGVETDYDTILEDTRQRDARDSGRDTAPLKPAHDAHIIDTSDMNADEVLERALSIAGKTAAF